MKHNISKFLIIFIFLIFSKYEIIKAKTDDEIFLGNKDAKIIVIEYASMTCIHCANFHKEVYPKIKENKMYIAIGSRGNIKIEEYPRATIQQLDLITKNK